MEVEAKSRERTLFVPGIVGPTASGKTKLATLLADRYSQIEVISADSRQIYVGMDIGTAKPSKEIRERIPHHLIDIHAPDHRYSAGQFARNASQAIESIISRGNIPLVVGGTGFYVHALFKGLSAPAADSKIYAELEKRLATEGYESLFNELLRVDPEAARLFPKESRLKTLRALTCWHQTGVCYSTFYDRDRYSSNLSPSYCLMLPERKQLYHRINKRVIEMFDEGLVDETKALIGAGYSANAPGLRTVGYKEVIEMFGGKIDSSEVIPAVQQSTRRYAKRQYTWFRNKLDSEVVTVETVSEGVEWFTHWIERRREPRE